jgi:hypothetical protein
VRSIPVPDPSGLHGIGKSARPFRFHDHRITIAEEFSTSKRCDDTTVRPWPAASRSSCRPRRVPSVRNRLGCSSQVLGDKKDTKRARAGGGDDNPYCKPSGRCVQRTENSAGAGDLVARLRTKQRIRRRNLTGTEVSSVEQLHTSHRRSATSSSPSTDARIRRLRLRVRPIARFRSSRPGHRRGPGRREYRRT